MLAEAEVRAMPYITYVELVVATLVAGGAVVTSAAYSGNHPMALGAPPLFNRMATHQCILLAISIAVVAYCRYRGHSALSFKRSSAGPLPGLSWIGIQGNRSWDQQLWPLLAKVAAPTALFMGLGIATSSALQCPPWQAIMWVPLFACTNALGEEIVFRYLPMAIGGEAISTRFVAWTSALLFGAAHYAGAPGGPIGMVMSAVLGYVLARATVETGSLRIAVIVHGVLDIIILAALVFISQPLP